MVEGNRPVGPVRATWGTAWWATPVILATSNMGAPPFCPKQLGRPCPPFELCAMWVPHELDFLHKCGLPGTALVLGAMDWGSKDTI